jgi:hypothetical protein
MNRSYRTVLASTISRVAESILRSAFCLAFSICAASLPAQTLPLPPRPANALTGAQFAARIAPLELAEREREIFTQIMAGNVPGWLRKLCPVQLHHVADSQTNTATAYVTPDYLAVGSDDDYLLINLSPNTAQRIADALDCTMPTRKLVNDIYAAAAIKLVPSPIPPSPAMTTVAVFSNHNATVRAQRGNASRGALVAGHQKDVVISPRLATAPGKLAIYGWHQTNGTPIQPLYLGHAASWVDYSQCIRLVHRRVLVNGAEKTVAEVLADPALAGLLSDEGLIASPGYPTNAVPKLSGESTSQSAPSAPSSIPTSVNDFQPGPDFNERVASFSLEPEVRIHINAPALAQDNAAKKILLIFYVLPNGNTTEQTVGKRLKPGDDWHFNIQHIGAQTRFLRAALPDCAVVVTYLENNLKSWPAWRKKYGDRLIPGVISQVQQLFVGHNVATVLSGHSGGGSLIFGYLNALPAIPDNVVRLAFLDSNYAYDSALGHEKKLAQWLNAGARHCLCVLAYNDAVALLEGKSFVSAAGGTWGKSHEMQRDLAADFHFVVQTNADFQKFMALDGRLQFWLKENPERKILHTVQVEQNGFIHSMLSGTSKEGQGYDYFGPRAYVKWISPQ